MPVTVPATGPRGPEAPGPVAVVGAQRYRPLMIRSWTRSVAVVVAVCLTTGAGTSGVASAEPPTVSSTTESARVVPDPPDPVPGIVPRQACGTPLGDGDLARLRDLTAPDASPALSTLEELERRTARSREVGDLLAAHGDRRGLFGVGLDEVESDPVLPLQRRGVAPDPEWARKLSLVLLEPYLTALHAHFSGAPVDEHWARYFSLAVDCRQRPAFVAMTGYNAHLTVDLARAVAATDAVPEDVGGYLEIVGGIADHRRLIIDRTLEVYGADLGPLWNLYVVGPAIDAVTGPGVGSGALLRFGDQAYSLLAFSHGLALQDPAVAPVAAGQVLGLWRDVDVVLQSITAVGGL